ncbi:MAG TPA: caspase family protein [Nitrospira sp.]|nr:caspase family protein [Nitrospira sp.]
MRGLMVGRRPLLPALTVVGAMACLSWLATAERLLAAADERGARRALLVGIDRYTTGESKTGDTAGARGRRHWRDLKGSVNDVRAFREVLIHRQGFHPQDILVLENEAATRDAILGAFRRHLISPAKAGDHSVFYYAGHGSRVRNSRSSELDGKDETIVPADANRHVGDRVIADIRDKEWDRLFSEVLDRGAWLTAFFDSCHSGSISRSAAPATVSTRYLDEDDRDVAELLEPDVPAHVAGMEPENRDGALIISAAQEDQEAKETVRLSGGIKEWHGAFSLALIQSLNELPQVNADRLFDRVTARLLADGYQQEPALAGTGLRRHTPLFGETGVTTDNSIRINVIQAYAADDVELQGGVAIGLTPDTELIRVSNSSDPELRIRVTEVRGLAKSRGQVVKGEWRRLHAGDELELVRKGVVAGSALPVWIPPASGDQGAAKAFAAELKRVLPANGVTLVDDPTVSGPTHVLSWDGTQWILWSDAPRPWTAGRAPQVEAIVNRMKAAVRRPVLFFSMPPTSTLVKTLSERLVKVGATATATPDEALYMLTGRLAGFDPEYAWVSTRLVRTGENGSGRVMPLPARSGWSASPGKRENCEAGGLEDCLARLAKVHYWLTIEAASRDDRFPYRLALKGLADDRTIERGDLIEGRYRLVLRAEPEAIERIGRALGLQSRYVYVFVIDQEGRVTQLFPNAGSREREHLLPRPESLKRPGNELAELPFGDSGVISVHAPFGTDTYLMITSAQAMPHLEELLEAGPVVIEASIMRGGGSDWSIDRLLLRTVPASP